MRCIPELATCSPSSLQNDGMKTFIAAVPLNRSPRPRRDVSYGLVLLCRRLG
jgi:hypothetical protein